MIQETEENCFIRIKSLQANSLYRVNNEYKDSYLDLGNAMINDSLFSEYIRKHGVTVNRRNTSLDFILMKFDYGVNGGLINGKVIPQISAQNLRKYYYENGATVTWNFTDKEGKKIAGKTKKITYKMLMRSTGKAKDGDCIFIREDLHKSALNYITMGLYDKMPVKNAKIVELSAYSTLITATAIAYIKLPMENIFVISDETVKTLKKAVTVKVTEVPYTKYKLDYNKTEDYINKSNLTFYKTKIKNNPDFEYIQKSKKALQEHGIDIEECSVEEIQYTNTECYVSRSDDVSEISNVLWDGQGLIDDSIFPDGMEGFIYCRSHFFKSCLFRGSVQQYFKDYYGDKYDSAVETDFFGRTIKVSDIKIIITENSLKWMKFIDIMGGTYSAAFKYYDCYMKKHHEQFAIVKTAHSSKWGKLQRSSYQINGSLPTVDENVLADICKTSIDYCNNLKLNHEAFMNHLQINGSSRCSINSVLIALDNWNDKFKYTKYFKDKKTDLISRFKKERLQLGKLLQFGDNLTICGNPVAMLMKVTGQDFLQEGCFEQIEDRIQCYTTKFKEGERIAGFRSPHNSPNNIIYLVNVRPAAIMKYFGRLGENIIIINGIGTDVQSRLNGQDLDTDSIYATNQEQIVELARQGYLDYPTIINGIKVVGSSDYEKNMENYAKMDSKISAAQYAIGFASNIAQLALSYYYNNGDSDRNLEDIFIICSVLAQVAIDSAKRNFEIDVMPELTRISKLDCMKNQLPKYPRFYADVQRLKEKQSKKKRIEIKESEIGDFNCPMDILYRIIDQEVIDLRKDKTMNTETVNLRNVFEYQTTQVKPNRQQYQKIIGIVKEYDNAVNMLDRTQKDYHKMLLVEFDSCMFKLKNLNIKASTMYTLIAYAFKDENAGIRDKLLTVLYDKDQKAFLNCFKKTQKKLTQNG